MILSQVQEKLFRKYPLEIGKPYLMSGIGDVGINVDARPFLGEVLTVVKHLKSGLYQTQLPDGRTYPFPKSALWPIVGETYKFLGGDMKTIQEGTLADAYKRALDTADTIAIYVSYEDPEQTHQALETVHEDLELDEDRVQSVLEEHNSSVMLVGFEPEDTMEEIVATLRNLAAGDGHNIAFVSPDHNIVKAVKESFNVN